MLILLAVCYLATGRSGIGKTPASNFHEFLGSFELLFILKGWCRKNDNPTTWKKKKSNHRNMVISWSLKNVYTFWIWFRVDIILPRCLLCWIYLKHSYILCLYFYWISKWPTGHIFYGKFFLYLEKDMRAYYSNSIWVYFVITRFILFFKVILIPNWNFAGNRI